MLRLLLVLPLFLQLILLPILGQAIEGQRIAQIQIEGLQRTNESLVRRQLRSKVGAIYSTQLRDADIEMLDRLGVFSQIHILPEASTSGVRLRVQVTETLAFLPYPAIDVNDENGISFGGGLKALNLFGRSVKLSASVRFGQEATNLEVTSESARLADPHWWYRVEFFQRDRTNELVQFEEAASELEVLHIGRQLDKDLRIGAAFSFLSLGADQAGVTLSPSNRDNTAGLGLVFEYDTRDLISNPRRGWWNSLDLSKHGGGFLGDGNFVTVNLDLRRFQPINDRHGMGLFSLLSLQSGSVNQDLPIYRQFFIGGTNSVRGWDLDARRGPNQWITTLEYRYELLPIRAFSFFGLKLFGGLQLAAFGDVGTAWDARGDFTRNFIGGGGIGLRVLFPFIQMIRFDFAWGEADRGTLFHLGVREKAFEQRKRVR